MCGYFMEVEEEVKAKIQTRLNLSPAKKSKVKVPGELTSRE